MMKTQYLFLVIGTLLFNAKVDAAGDFRKGDVLNLTGPISAYETLGAEDPRPITLPEKCKYGACKYELKVFHAARNSVIFRLVKGHSRLQDSFIEIRRSELDTKLKEAMTKAVPEISKGGDKGCVTTTCPSTESKKVAPMENEIPDDVADVDTSKLSWIAGCEILKSGTPPESEENVEKLLKCIENIRNKVGYKIWDRRTILRNLYTKLNPIEQEYAAMIFTVFGEARGYGIDPAKTQEEMMLIMQVIKNRKNKALRSDLENVNYLDIVLQPSQFEPYNPKDKKHPGSGSDNFKTMFQKKIDVKKAFRDSVLAFVRFPKATIKQADEPWFLDMRHFVMKDLVNSKNAPSWIDDPAEKNRSTANVVINGKTFDENNKGHIFYSGIRQGFRSNNFRPKEKK